MRLQTLALLAGASVVAADSTVTLFLPGFGTQSIEGKILGSSGPMTTYLLNCPAGEGECGLPPNGYSITEGASSLEMGYSYGGQTVSQYCKLQGTTHADCVATVTSDGSTSAITTGFDIASIPYGGFMPVHLTATESAGAPASTGASASPSTATSTGASTITGTVSSTSSSSATTTASTTGSSNAALPMVTGNAGWVIGGAAALVLAVV